MLKYEITVSDPLNGKVEFLQRSYRSSNEMEEFLIAMALRMVEDPAAKLVVEGGRFLVPVVITASVGARVVTIQADPQPMHDAVREAETADEWIKAKNALKGAM